MDTAASPQFRKIRVVSRLLKWGCVIGMIMPPLFLIGAIAGVHYEGTQWDFNGEPREGPWRDRLLIDLEFAVGFLPQIALIWGMNQLRLLFSGFAAGRIFSGDHVAHLHRFGKALLVYAVVSPIFAAITYTISTIGEEPLKGRFFVSNKDVEVALVGLFFYVLGWVFREGARLSEENAQIV